MVAGIDKRDDNDDVDEHDDTDDDDDDDDDSDSVTDVVNKRITDCDFLSFNKFCLLAFLRKRNNDWRSCIVIE